MSVRSPSVRTWGPAVSTWTPVALHACYWLVVLVSFRENVAVAQNLPGQGVRAHVQEWKGVAAGPFDVAIVGEIAQPGVYRLPQTNLTLGGLLTQAGGTTQAATGHVKITRNGRSVQQFMLGSSATETLFAGDVVIIEGPPTRANRQAPRPVQLTLLGVLERPIVVKLSAENARIDVLVELLGQAPDVARAARLIGRPAAPATATLPAQLATGNILVFNPRAIDAGRLPGFPAVIETPAATASSPDLQLTQAPPLPAGFTPIPPLHTASTAQTAAVSPATDVSLATALPLGVGQTVSATNPTSIVGPAGSTWLAGTSPPAEVGDPFTIPPTTEELPVENTVPVNNRLPVASPSQEEAVFSGVSPERMSIPAPAPIQSETPAVQPEVPLTSSNLVDAELSLDDELTDPPLELESEMEGNADLATVSGAGTSGLGLTQWTTLFVAIGMVLGGGWLLSRWTNREAALANPSRRSLSRTRSKNSSSQITQPMAMSSNDAEPPVSSPTPAPHNVQVPVEHLDSEHPDAKSMSVTAALRSTSPDSPAVPTAHVEPVSAHTAIEEFLETNPVSYLVTETAPLLPFADILKQPALDGVVHTNGQSDTTLLAEDSLQAEAGQLASQMPVLPASTLPLMPEPPQTAPAHSAIASTRIERLMRNDLPQEIMAVSLPATIELSGEPQFGRKLRIDEAVPRFASDDSQQSGEATSTKNVAGPHFTVRAPMSRGNAWSNNGYTNHTDEVQPPPQKPLGNTVAARHSSRLVQALAQLQEARQ